MIQKLIESLLDGRAYPEPTAQVTLVETHVSFILLTDHFAYKIKKGVDFGFLNFSTLALRRFYCQEELRLNRRLCPDIYLAVVELRETPQGASFAVGDGRVLDYAVKMKRLPQERMLPGLLERGLVGPAQMGEIACVLADFHGKAARSGKIDRYGRAEVIRANWEESFRQMAPFLEETISAADLHLLGAWVESFLAKHQELLRARVKGGFIRECDGDLHMGNICLADRIYIFDCIEFNKQFRYIDTAADIAFLLMDLEYAGHPELSSSFLKAYQSASGDLTMGALLGFYQGYRAFVRGEVKSFLLREPGVAPATRTEAKASARRYFRLARGYCLRERLPPSLIITCGLMGSGKSALAREIGFELGLVVTRSDSVRKKLSPVTTDRGASDDYGLGMYDASCNQATYQALLFEAEQLLSQGRSVIVDATFQRAADRASFRDLAKRLDASFFILQTRAPEALIRERLENRRLNPDEFSDGRWELFARQAAQFEPPAPGEAIVVESHQPLPATVDQALQGMGLLPPPTQP
jgi:aminoglycoside phosphotransferase family enzyme/predicted kinase